MSKAIISIVAEWIALSFDTAYDKEHQIYFPKTEIKNLARLIKEERRYAC